MAHRDIVIVPAYFRPEFLHLCIEHLYACPEMLNKDLWIYHDQKFDDLKTFESDFSDVENDLVYWRRGFGNRLRTVIRPENGFYGNSYNVLGAYAKAFETDAKYVYLVEEDVLVTPDFFKWHEAVQNNGNYFSSVAGQCDRNETIFKGDAIDCYFESEQYASLGVCWKRENLQSVIEHAVFEYYHNPTPHILKHFPNSKFGLWAMEQDGLIQRIMEQRFQKAAFACVPRAYHVGIWGYHRHIGADNLFQGNFAERTEQLRISVRNKEWLDKVAGFQNDIQPYPSEPIPVWESVQRIPS